MPPFPTYAYQSLVGGGLVGSTNPGAATYGNTSNQYAQGAWALQDTEIRCAVAYSAGGSQGDILLFGGGQWGSGLSSLGGRIYGYYNLTSTPIVASQPAVECQMPTYDTAVEAMWYGNVGGTGVHLVSRIFAGVSNNNGYLKVYVRDTGNSSWVPSQEGPLSSNVSNPNFSSTQVRSGVTYQDSITGANLVFCGADDGLGWGGVFQGTCNSTATSTYPTEFMGIEWGPTPELDIAETNANFISGYYTYTGGTGTLTVLTSFSGANLAVGAYLLNPKLPIGAQVSAIGTASGGIGTYTLSGAGSSDIGGLASPKSFSASAAGFTASWNAATQLLTVTGTVPANQFITNGMVLFNTGSYSTSAYTSASQGTVTIASQVAASNAAMTPGGIGTYTLNNGPTSNVTVGTVYGCYQLPEDLIPRVMTLASGPSGTQQITVTYVQSTSTLTVTAVQMGSLGVGTVISGANFPSDCSIASCVSGTGYTGTYTLLNGPSSNISSPETVLATSYALFATVGSQVWQRFDGLSPTWRPVWTKPAQAMGVESSQSGLRGLASIDSNSGFILFPEGTDWAVVTLTPWASTLSTPSAFSWTHTPEYTLSDLQSDMDSNYLSGWTVSYVIGCYNGDYSAITYGSNSYGLIGLHTLVSATPTASVATYSPSGATGAPAVCHAFYLTRTTGPLAHTLLRVASQVSPQTESIRFMIPCGTSLVAAGGFDYDNAPNQTVYSRPIAATVSGYTMTVTSPPTPSDLYVGTVISDSGNVLPPGTFISNWGTGTGGAGTYTLNNSGTVTSGETVTAVTGGVGSTDVNGFGWIAFDTVSNVAQGI